MLRKPTVLFALLLSALWCRSLTAAERLPPASQWLPKNAIIAVELSRPKEVLDLFTSPKACEAVAGLPAYQKAAKQPGFQQFVFVVHYLEARLGADWKTALHKLLDGGVALAATPDGGSLMIVDAQDPKMLGQLHGVFVEFAKAEAGKRGETDAVRSAGYRGVTGWTLGKGQNHAILGSRLDIRVPGHDTTVRISYRTSPTASGLQWLEAPLTTDKQQPLMFSQSESIHARSWVPLQDTPGVRFTYGAHICTPAGVMALMSADNDPAARRDGDYSFRMAQPIPSYLLAIAVGDLVFKPISGRSGVWAEASMADKAAAEFSDT